MFQSGILSLMKIPVIYFQNALVSLAQRSPNFINEGPGGRIGATGSRKCPGISEYTSLIIGINGRNSAPLLVSMRGIVPHHRYQWKE
ncbi:unnamed protein product [Staurois parvus]|uniref:Uncharacterized protein n=1 Tax=Staurois parvus TaxID=386267 RepID=A0ABN9BGY2_9NEOB|nr:unnamed protein product [Staurois parvus]